MIKLGERILEFSISSMCRRYSPARRQRDGPLHSWVRSFALLFTVLVDSDKLVSLPDFFSAIIMKQNDLLLKTVTRLTERRQTQLMLLAWGVLPITARLPILLASSLLGLPPPLLHTLPGSSSKGLLSLKYLSQNYSPCLCLGESLNQEDLWSP